MSSPLGCPESYRAFVYDRGGTSLIGELPVSRLKWNRERDTISTAEVVVPTQGCCDWIGEVRTVRHELHVVRDDETVWQGPIHLIEYEREAATIEAQDMLRVAKYTALEEGYNHAYPNIAACGWRMNELLTTQCYAKYGDPWNMMSHIHRLESANEAGTSKIVAAFSCTVWEDFDAFAAHSGMDYTVVSRDIYFWDTHYVWKQLPDLSIEHLGQWPAIVEYGSELATRVFVTNNNGVAGMSQAPADFIAYYGYVDSVMSSWNEAPTTDDEEAAQEELEGLIEQSGRELDQRYPAPVRIRVGDNNTLLRSSPWTVDDLIPGAWFMVSTPEGFCRSMTDWHKLDSVRVTYINGVEKVMISTLTAPENMVMPS